MNSVVNKTTIYRLIVSVLVLVFVAAIAASVLLTERGEYAQNNISYDYDRPRATPEERFFAAANRIAEEFPLIIVEEICVETVLEMIEENNKGHW